jgi:hypothetical protein
VRERREVAARTDRALPRHDRHEVLREEARERLRELDRDAGMAAREAVQAQGPRDPHSWTGIGSPTPQQSEARGSPELLEVRGADRDVLELPEARRRAVDGLAGRDVPFHEVARARIRSRAADAISRPTFSPRRIEARSSSASDVPSSERVRAAKTSIPDRGRWGRECSDRLRCYLVCACLVQVHPTVAPPAASPRISSIARSSRSCPTIVPSGSVSAAIS